jgi:glucose/arabinose dehydrogenase
MKGVGNSVIAAFLWAGALLLGGRIPACAEPLKPPASPGSPRLPDRIPGDGYRLINAFPEVTFREPVALAAPPGETNRLFVVERTGTIYVLTNLARPSKTVFLNLAQSVNASYLEAGLLGLVFHPGFSTNRYFFVFQTKQTSTPGAMNRFHDVVSRFEASPGDPNTAMASTEVTILAQLDDSDVHNGGDLKFGPDGYL